MPGYKFEALATLPTPWAETSREYIEDRENHIVNNKEQYCSVVRTGIGKATLCLGGEVDASTSILLSLLRSTFVLQFLCVSLRVLLTPSVWDSKPVEKGAPINWVELKTSVEIRGPHDADVFQRKLMKFWIQSFLLGVPKIIVGFRTRDGVLASLDEIDTHRIPQTVNSRPNPSWNADMCVNFAGVFLECEPPSFSL